MSHQVLNATFIIKKIIALEVEEMEKQPKLGRKYYYFKTNI